MMDKGLKLIFGGFCWYWVTLCAKHHEIEDYQMILVCNVGPSVRNLGLYLKSWVFQQYNDPELTSKGTKK